MNTTRPTFLNSVAEWVRLNFKSLALAVLIIFMTFPKFPLIYWSGIDYSLPWVFSYFANDHFSLGQYTLIPHGRLAFLLYPLFMGNNVLVSILVTCICSVLFSLNMFRIFLKHHPKNYITAAILLLIIHTVIDLQLLIIGLTFSYVLLSHSYRKWIYLSAAVFFSVFAFYVKLYCGVLCVLILASECISVFYMDKKVKPLIQVMVLFLFFFYGFWLALYHSFAGSVSFLIGQCELASDNSEAVSLYPKQNWWQIGTGLVCLLSLPFFSRDRQANYFFRIMLLALFAAWKHAMSRSDIVHLSFFIGFLVLLVVSFLMISKEPRVFIIILGTVSLLAFRLNVPKIGDSEVVVLRPRYLYDLLFDYKAIEEEKKRSIAEDNINMRLPDTLLHLIGKKTVDIFPWNYAIIPTNDLNWQPRPVIHSYAAYTSWLEEQNSKHIQSEKAPQFFLWEITPYKLSGIDDRYLLNDEPGMLIELFNHYDLKYKDASYLLYEKRPEKFSFTKTDLGGEQTLINDSLIALPEHDPTSVLRVKLHVKKSIPGRLLGFIYKSDAFYITYFFEDNSSYKYRIVPKNAAEGLWLYPLILNPGSDTIGKKVKKIKIVCSDDRMIDTDYKIQFEQIKFDYHDSGTGFEERAFGKTILPSLPENTTATPSSQKPQ